MLCRFPMEVLLWRSVKISARDENNKDEDWKEREVYSIYNICVQGYFLLIVV